MRGKSRHPGTHILSFSDSFLALQLVLAYHWFAFNDAQIREVCRNYNAVYSRFSLLFAAAAFNFYPHRIHLFGFSQGGTMALHVAMQICQLAHRHLGSVVKSPPTRLGQLSYSETDIQ